MFSIINLKIKSKMKKGFFWLIFMPLIVWQPKVLGEWKICNSTRSDVSIAIGYEHRGQFVSEGWWTIGKGGECQTVLTDDLENRYYYFHGRHIGVDGDWEGDYYFCTSNNVFRIYGDKNCRVRGYESTRFMVVDVENNTSFTTNLITKE